MNAYTDMQVTIVRQIQADRQAEAAANRFPAHQRRWAAPRGAEDGTGRFQRMAAAFRVDNRATRA